MRRARLKHFANLLPTPPLPSPQGVKPQPRNPDESRQQCFRRVLKHETRKIREHVTVIGPSGHPAYVEGATRQRVRTLSRKMARQAARFS